MRNLPTIFQFGQSKIQNPPTLVKNHTKFAQSMLISQVSLHPVVKLLKFMAFRCFAISADFMHFAQMEINPGWSEFNEIRTISLNRFCLGLCKAGPTPCLSELREFCNLKLQLAKYQFLHNF